MSQTQSLAISREIAELRQILNLGLERLSMLESRLDFMQIAEKDEWITTAEASAICKVDKSTLTRYALIGRVEAKRVGSQWRFPKSRVQDMTFLKS